MIDIEEKKDLIEIIKKDKVEEVLDPELEDYYLEELQRVLGG